MYKNNSPDNSKFKGYSPCQPSYDLTEKHHAVGYYSYIKRWQIVNTGKLNQLKLKNEKSI